MLWASRFHGLGNYRRPLPSYAVDRCLIALTITLGKRPPSLDGMNDSVAADAC